MGVTLTVTGGTVSGVFINDGSLSGAHAIGLNAGATLRDSRLEMPDAVMTINTTSGTMFPIRDSRLNVSRVAVTTGRLENCVIITSHIELVGDASSINGCEARLSPSVQDAGILLTGDLCAVQDSWIVCVLPSVTNTKDAIEVDGDIGLLDGLRFSRSGARSWRYLIDDNSAGLDLTIGSYVTTTDAWATGEIAP